jgi:hypothetical protein
LTGDTRRKTKKERQLAHEGGKGVGEEPNHKTARKSLLVHKVGKLIKKNHENRCKLNREIKMWYGFSVTVIEGAELYQKKISKKDKKYRLPAINQVLNVHIRF